MTATGDRVAWHFRETRTDAGLVRAAVWLEQLAVLAYEAAAPVVPVAARFAGHEREHAAAMETVLQGLTVHVRSRPGTADVAFHLPRLGDDPVGSLTALEASLVAGYGILARRTVEPAVLRTVATVVAGGAQHLAVLRRE